MTVLEKQFLGKRVSIKTNVRDNNCKLTKELTTVTGICKFIGPNELLGFQLQVTLDRTPFEVKHINDIELI